MFYGYGSGESTFGIDQAARDAAQDALAEAQTLTPQPEEQIAAGVTLFTPFGIFTNATESTITLDDTDPQTEASLISSGLISEKGKDIFHAIGPDTEMWTIRETKPWIVKYTVTTFGPNEGDWIHRDGYGWDKLPDGSDADQKIADAVDPLMSAIQGMDWSYGIAQGVTWVAGDTATGSDKTLYKLAADAIGTDHGVVATATERDNLTAEHGDVAEVTGVSKYYYDTIAGADTWQPWNGTDAIPANPALDPVDGVSSWVVVSADILVSAEAAARSAEIAEAVKKKPTVYTSIAAMIADSTSLPVGVSAITESYYEPSDPKFKIGGGFYRLLGAADAESRPSENGGTIHHADGARYFQLNAKVGMVDVSQWGGAKERVNSTTHAHTEIQAALDHAAVTFSATSTPTKSKAYFPGWNYQTGAVLSWPEGVELCGDGMDATHINNKFSTYAGPILTNKETNSWIAGGVRDMTLTGGEHALAYSVDVFDNGNAENQGLTHWNNVRFSQQTVSSIEGNRNFINNLFSFCEWNSVPTAIDIQGPAFNANLFIHPKFINVPCALKAQRVRTSHMLAPRFEGVSPVLSDGTIAAISSEIFTIDVDEAHSLTLESPYFERTSQNTIREVNSLDGIHINHGSFIGGQRYTGETADTSAGTMTHKMVTDGEIVFGSNSFFAEVTVNGAQTSGYRMTAKSTGSGLTYNGPVTPEHETFTPTLDIATPGDAVISYATQSGRVVTVGKMKTVQIYIKATITHTTASGVLNIKSLPLAATTMPDGQQLDIGKISKISFDASHLLTASIVGQTATMYHARSGNSLESIKVSHLSSGVEFVTSLTGTYEAA